MNICLISPLPPPYGGISHWTTLIVTYAKTQPDLEIDVIDIAPRWREVHDISRWKRVMGGGLQLIRDIFIFIWELLTKRPQVVHLTTPGSMAILRDVALLLVARFSRTPVVYHIRFGRVPLLLKRTSGLEPFLFRIACKMASCVIAIDKGTYNSLLGMKLKRSPELIPNCFDPVVLPEVTKACNYVVFIGWIIPAKGVEDLIAAWRSVVAPDWRLIFVGPGDSEYIEHLVDLAVGMNVEFLGEMEHSEAMRVLSSSGILVLPSHTEGFPNVVLEGMALGKPVVATSVGAVPEMLSGGAGVLVPVNDVVALAAALQGLIADPISRRDFGNAAKIRAIECYSVDSVFAAYRDLWSKLFMNSSLN